MRHKLTIPWTARLPMTRWLIRRHSPLAKAAARTQKCLVSPQAV